MIVSKYPWLQPALKSNTIENFSSCLLIEGEAGLAKSKLANYFAKKLLCLDENKPCDSCNSCSYFEAGSHPDYCFLSADQSSASLLASSKAKNDSLVSKKIEGIRALNHFMSFTSSVSLNRVGVIYDAHMMNINAQNALLKTLEELPDNKFILIISNKRRYFLPTIYSRAHLLSIQNPSAFEIDQWLSDQGFIDHSSLNFAPDTTPLIMEKLIHNNLSSNYQDLTSALNSYCLGKIDTFDLLKFFKELNISLDEKIDSIIMFLKNCLGINMQFYKTNPIINAVNPETLNSRLISELIEEMIQFKVDLNKVPSLNEQIGLSHFIFKLQRLFR